MKKILITGISGFLGWYLAQHQSERWEITGLYNTNKPALKVPTIQLDLTNPNEVDAFLKRANFDAIINTAAISNGNQCEDNPDLSFQINVIAAEHLAKHAQQQNIPFLHTSTDLVFDGKNAPYHPTAKTSAISTYGHHKAEAETRILTAYPDATIARLPLMYGTAHAGQSFSDQWISNLKSGKTVNVFTDEFRTPSHGSKVAEGLFLLLEKEVKGIWHLGGATALSRYDFAIQMAEHYQLDTSLIVPTLQSELTFKAPRPANVSLNSEGSFNLGFSSPIIFD